MKFFVTLATTAVVSLSVSLAMAQTISTTFSNAEGFATGSTDPVTLFGTDFGASFDVTFADGVQLQSFDAPSYNDGPDAYLIINGTFGGTTASSDIGTISFSSGVDEVSFFAADRANGTPTLRVLDTSGAILTTESITGTSNQSGAGATPFSFSSSVLGAQIGAIEFDNAGPASNPPYVIAIDSFSASAIAVPEPSSVALIGLAMGCAVLRRRR